ncbi:MAG TPA: AAA family ATPase [Chloroflexia bacterium]|nr:AAA family ATPase [Chloroflexia bacterium]
MSQPDTTRTEAAPADGPAAPPAPAGRAGVTRTAWWLSTRRRRPEWQSLAGAGLATFSGRPRANFESAQTGDPVLIYVARPDRAIRAVGIVTHVGGGPADAPPAAPAPPEPDAGAPPAPKEALHIEVQFAFEVTNPLPWPEIQALPGLADAEPVKQRSSGTLFYLSPAEYTILQDRLIARNPELAAPFAAIDSGQRFVGEPESDAPAETPLRAPARFVREPPPGYSPTPPAPPPRLPPALPAVASVADLQQLTGLPAATLEEARDLLEDTGQIVLNGPPGTGKTWLARGLAALAAGDPARVQIVQFHPATAYEDFIEGLKPSVDAWGHVTYAVLPGIFVRMCQAARRDPEHHYVLIVDEINRAPLARVFGELLYALEYRGPQGAVELSVSAGIGGPPQPFYVPENLLLIGTMNSADRSLALVDYALRRRFRFIEIEPHAGVLDAWLRDHGTAAAARQTVLQLFQEVNSRLSEALDPDHRLGHSYFMLDPLNRTTLDRLWRTAIRPLIAEYFIPPAGEIDEYHAMFALAAAALDAPHA